MAELTIGLACAIALLAPRTTTTEGQRITLVGMIEDKSALLYLKAVEETRAQTDDAWNGHVEVAGEPPYVLHEIGEKAPHDMKFGVYRRTRDSDGTTDTPCGVWKGRLSPDDLQFDGTWIDGPLGSAVPLTFRAIASDGTVVRHSGWRIAGRGRTALYEGSYPRFLSPTPLDREAERDIQKLVEQAASDSAPFHLWSDRQDLWYVVRHGSPTNEWEYHDEWRLTFRSDRLVSLVCDTWSYTGGVHGNSTTESRVYWWNGHDAMLVQLADFFAPTTGWESKLAKLCNRELGLQKSLRWYDKTKKPEDLEPGVAIEDLDSFTVHQDGIRFHFPPYSIGSYAEGAYEAHVPYQAIADLLRNTGPAAALSGFRIEAR